MTASPLILHVDMTDKVTSWAAIRTNEEGTDGNGKQQASGAAKLSRYPAPRGVLLSCPFLPFACLLLVVSIQSGSGSGGAEETPSSPAPAAAAPADHKTKTLNLLLSRIEGGEPSVEQQYTLAPTLVQRDSVARPRT